MYAPGAGKEKCRPHQGRLSPERLLFKAEALLIERFSLRSGHRGVSLPGCRTRCFHRITPDAMEFVQQFTIHFNSTEVPINSTQGFAVHRHGLERFQPIASSPRRASVSSDRSRRIVVASLCWFLLAEEVPF